MCVDVPSILSACMGALLGLRVWPWVRAHGWVQGRACISSWVHLRCGWQGRAGSLPCVSCHPEAQLRQRWPGARLSPSTRLTPILFLALHLLHTPSGTHLREGLNSSHLGNQDVPQGSAPGSVSGLISTWLMVAPSPPFSCSLLGATPVALFSNGALSPRICEAHSLLSLETLFKGQLPRRAFPDQLI